MPLEVATKSAEAEVSTKPANESSPKESTDAAALKETKDKPSEEKTSQAKYTEEELHSRVRKAVSAALAEQGGSLGRERDTFKSQSEKLSSDLKTATDKLTELQADRDQMVADIENLSTDDPDKAGKLSKRLKDLDTAINSAKSKEDAAERRVKELEAQMQPYAETVNFALGVTLETSVFEVAGEYDNANAEALIELCGEMGVKGDKDTEQLKGRIRKVADILWTKKGKQSKSEEPAIVNDSGVNHGGKMVTKYTIMQDYNSGKINAVEYQKRMKEIGIIV